MSNKTLVVHPWSGTVLDAEDGVIVVIVTEQEAQLDDSQIIQIAVDRGLLIPLTKAIVPNLVKGD